jgi:hypothetical protein
MKPALEAASEIPIFMAKAANILLNRRSPQVVSVVLAI